MFLLQNIKSTLPGGIKITKGKLRGVMSYGMMCSTDELGISKERASGILILPDDTPIGEDITETLGLNESVAEFEITSNRPDCGEHHRSCPRKRRNL